MGRSRSERLRPRAWRHSVHTLDLPKRCADSSLLCSTVLPIEGAVRRSYRLYGRGCSSTIELPELTADRTLSPTLFVSESLGQRTEAQPVSDEWMTLREIGTELIFSFSKIGRIF